jgi:hypothetical protein
LREREGGQLGKKKLKENQVKRRRRRKRLSRISLKPCSNLCGKVVLPISIMFSSECVGGDENPKCDGLRFLYMFDFGNLMKQICQVSKERTKT